MLLVSLVLMDRISLHSSLIPLKTKGLLFGPLTAL